jgi:transposase
MRTGKSMSVSPADRRRLQALMKDRNAAQKHVWRAEIVLFTADGVGTSEIMRRTGKSKTCVWRWQERFIEEGFEGLLRDKTRPSRIKPLGSEAAERVVALTLGDPPGETTHWTGALMAKASGLSVSSVQRMSTAEQFQAAGAEQNPASWARSPTSKGARSGPFACRRRKFSWAMSGRFRRFRGRCQARWRVEALFDAGLSIA